MELQQSKPFNSQEEEAHLNVIRTAEWLTSGFSEVLKPLDLTPTQYNVLRILRGAGDAGISCSQIGGRMVTKDSDITRLLDRLESRELISRSREATDRRVILTHITQKGLQILAELDTPILDYHRRQLGHLGEQRLTALIDLLESVRESSG